MNTVPYPLTDELAAFFPMLGRLVNVLELDATDRLYGFAMLEDLDQFQSHVSQTEASNKTLDRGVVLRILAGHRNFEYATNNLDEFDLTCTAARLREEALAYLDTQENPPVYTPLGWADEPLDTFAAPILEQIFTAGNGELPTIGTPVHFGSAYDPSISESQSKAETTQRSFLRRRNARGRTLGSTDS